MSRIVTPPASIEHSPILASWLDRIPMVDGVVYDIACGYGRNGSYVLKRGGRVCFVDINEDLLRSIKNGRMQGLTKNEISRSEFLAIDLCAEKIEFPSGGIAGAIIVHFYDYETVRTAIEAVSLGGFVYIETISDRGDNYLELPRLGQVCSLLGDCYSVLYHKIRSSSKDKTMKLVKVFAVRVR